MEPLRRHAKSTPSVQKTGIMLPTATTERSVESLIPYYQRTKINGRSWVGDKHQNVSESQNQLHVGTRFGWIHNHTFTLT